MLQSTYRHHSVARQPLETIWMMPNSTMAGTTSMNTSSTPSRIIPPAMPNRPETKELASTVTPMTARATGASI